MTMPTMYMAITGERDNLGRAPFTLFWLQDGKRRGQCFRAVPEIYIQRGATLADSETAAQQLAWGTP